MEVSLDDFRRHFELLSDAALLETNRDELVEGARLCFDEEVARRGLNAPPAREAVAEPVSHQESPAEELVLVATYNNPDEAGMARSLLESAQIPFRLENEFQAFMSVLQLRLLVPAAFEADALEVLESQISDEELAAQAEAAASAEENPEEHSEEEL